ncbi:UNVERIFIED_ORG: hypothetical protein M2348_001309 [Sphingomonas sp. R1F5B]
MARRYTMFSAGQGSFRAAMIDRRRHPDAEFGLVFTDTLYEDADAYRFLIEGAALVTGRRLNWTVRAEDFPDYRVPEDVPIEEYHGNPEWRAFLADLRARTIDAIPELVWLVEGRDPWEVFRDRKLLGSSLHDPCSEVLKRIISRKWMMGQCWRAGELFGAADVFVYGIGDHEAHRFDDGEGGGLRPRLASEGWRAEAPLIEINDALTRGENFPAEILRLMAAPLAEIGIAEPRLYQMGYLHNNCGGFCCKAGQAHWANRFYVQPLRYSYDAMMERKFIAWRGDSFTMMTDRRGGDGKKPLSLDAFAERLRAEPSKRYRYLPGDSGCACFAGAA